MSEGSFGCRYVVESDRILRLTGSVYEFVNKDDDECLEHELDQLRYDLITASNRIAYYYY